MKMMVDSWFLLFNTQRSGVEWLCDVVRNFSDVPVRLNINPLDEHMSLRGRTLGKIENVKYRHGHERITTHPLEYGPADLFEHVEDNIDADVIAMMDVYSVSLFLNVLADFPEQSKILRSKKFRCSALIMNPVKAIDSNVRRIIKAIKEENENTLDISSIGQALYPHDQVLFDFLKRAYRVEDDEDILFLTLLLHVSYKLAEDLFLAHQFNIPVLTLEKMISDASYLASILPMVTCGGWTPSVNEISALQKEHMDTESGPGWLSFGRFPEKKTENKSLDSYFAEPKKIYDAMPEWRRDCLSLVFYIYQIFELYGNHDYDLSWTRAHNQYPAISCEKMFSYDLNHILLKGPQKSRKPFNVAVRRRYMNTSGAGSFSTTGHYFINRFASSFRGI